MSSYALVAKATATGIGYGYNPSVCIDSGKVYAKAQGETDVNIYNIATDTWSSLSLPSTNFAGHSGYPYYFNTQSSTQTQHEHIIVSGNYIYALYLLRESTGGFDGDYGLALDKFNLSDGTRVSCASLSNAFDLSYHANSHSTLVTDNVSGRVFYLNFVKQVIYEINLTNMTASLVKTWTEAFQGNECDLWGGPSAVCLNGKIYLMGSRYVSYFSFLPGPLEIDIDTWTVTEKAAYPDYGNQCAYTYNRISFGSWFTLGNLIYCVGGKIQSNSSNTGGGSTDATARNLQRFITYNPSTNTWSDGATIANPLMYTGVASTGEVAYLISGYESESFTQKNYEFAWHPGSVTGLSFDYVPYDHAVVLSWSYADTEPDCFKISRKTPGNSFEEIGTTANGTVLTYTDVNLVANTTYIYSVVAQVTVT